LASGQGVLSSEDRKIPLGEKMLKGGLIGMAHCLHAGGGKADKKERLSSVDGRCVIVCRDRGVDQITHDCRRHRQQQADNADFRTHAEARDYAGAVAEHNAGDQHIDHRIADRDRAQIESAKQQGKAIRADRVAALPTPDVPGFITAGASPIRDD
jgi:hypothetical protein